MATRTKLIEQCRRLGVALYDDGTSNGTLIVECPHGYTCDGVHGLIAEYGRGSGSKASAYADLASRLELGLAQCEDSDCDCHTEQPTDPDEYARIYRTERIA